MKKVSILTVIGAVLFGFASCTSDDEKNITPAGEGQAMTFRGSSSLMRTQLDGDSTTNFVLFQSGDQIGVCDAATTAANKFTTSQTQSEPNAGVDFTGSAATLATGQYYGIVYPYDTEASASGTTDALTITTKMKPEQECGAELNDKHGSSIKLYSYDPKANIAVALAEGGSSKPSFTLKNVCGLVKFITTADYQKIVISSKKGNEPLGASSIKVNAKDGSLAETPSSGTFDNITLVPKNGGVIPAGRHYAVILPGTFAEGLKFTFTDADGKNAGSKVITGATGGVEVSQSRVRYVGYVIPEKPTPVGNFTVGMDEGSPRKVDFAPANLYCTQNGSSYSFAFEEKQYYFRTYKNQSGKGDKAGAYLNDTNHFNTSDTYTCPNNTSGHFSWVWSTYSGTDADIAQKSYGAFFTQTSLSGDVSDVSLFNSNRNNLTEDSLASNITVDGQAYRLLTTYEWKYLLEVRKLDGGTACARYAKAKVHGVPGLLIIPDGYEVNTTDNTTEVGGVEISNVNQASTIWTEVKQIEDTEWDSLNDAGCVFLPCAGYHYSNTVDCVGSHGSYWSASAYSDASCAYGVYFYPSSVNPQYCYGYRCRGQALRLVCVSE